MSSELYSIGDRNYFGFNGTLYTLPTTLLNIILDEVKDMNPLTCAEYLIEQATKKNRFNKITP